MANQQEDLDGLGGFAFGASIVAATGFNGPMVTDRQSRGGLKYISGALGDTLADIDGSRIQLAMLVFVGEDHRDSDGVNFELRLGGSYYTYELLTGDPLVRDSRSRYPNNTTTYDVRRWKRFNFGEQTGLPAFETTRATGEYILRLGVDTLGERVASWELESDFPANIHAIDSDGVSQRIGTLRAGLGIDFEFGPTSDLTLVSMAAIITDSEGAPLLNADPNAIRNLLGVDTHFSIEGASDFGGYEDAVGNTALTNLFRDKINQTNIDVRRNSESEDIATLTFQNMSQDDLDLILAVPINQALQISVAADLTANPNSRRFDFKRRLFAPAAILPGSVNTFILTFTIIGAPRPADPLNPVVVEDDFLTANIGLVANITIPNTPLFLHKRENSDQWTALRTEVVRAELLTGGFANPAFVTAGSVLTITNESDDVEWISRDDLLPTTSTDSEVVKKILAGDNITSTYFPESDTIVLSAQATETASGEQISTITQGNNVNLDYQLEVLTINVDSEQFATDSDDNRIRKITTGADIVLTGDSELKIAVDPNSFATTQNGIRINSIIGGDNVTVSEAEDTTISIHESEFAHFGGNTKSDRILEIAVEGGLKASPSNGVLTLTAESEAIPLFDSETSYGTGDLLVVDLPATISNGISTPFTESIYKVLRTIPVGLSANDLFIPTRLDSDITGDSETFSPYIEEAYAPGNFTEIVHEQEERLISYIDQQISSVKEQQQQLVEILDVTDIDVFEGKHDANWHIDLSRDTGRLPYLTGTTTGRVIQRLTGIHGTPFNPPRDLQSPKAGLFNIRSGNTDRDSRINEHMTNNWANAFQYYVRQYVAIRPIFRDTATNTNQPNTGEYLRTWVNQDPTFDINRGSLPDSALWNDSNFIIYINGYNDYRYAFTPPGDFHWDGVYEFVSIDADDLPTADVRADAHRSGSADTTMVALPGIDANNPIDRSPETPLPKDGLRIATVKGNTNNGSHYVSITLATIAEAKAFATLVDQSMGGNGTDLPGYLMAHNADNFNWYPLCTSYRTNSDNTFNNDPNAQLEHNGINVRYPSLDRRVDADAQFATNLHRVDIYPNNPHADSDASAVVESFDRVLTHSQEYEIRRLAGFTDINDSEGYLPSTFPQFDRDDPTVTVRVDNELVVGFLGTSFGGGAGGTFSRHRAIDRVIFVPRIDVADPRRIDDIDRDPTRDGLLGGTNKYVELESIIIDSDSNRTFYAAQLDQLIPFELSNLSVLSLNDLRVNPYHRPKEFRYSDETPRTLDVPSVEYTRNANESATWITFNMTTPESFTDYLSGYEEIGDGTTTRNYFGGLRRGISVWDSELGFSNQNNANTPSTIKFANNPDKYILIDGDRNFGDQLVPGLSASEHAQVKNKYISNVPRWSQGVAATVPEKFNENFFNPNSSSTNRHTVYLDQARIFIPRDRFVGEAADTPLPIDFTKGHIPAGPSWIISNPEGESLRYSDINRIQDEIYFVPFGNLADDSLPVTLRTNVTDFRSNAVPDADFFDIETRTGTGHLEVNELYALRRNANMFNPTIHGITIIPQEIDTAVLEDSEDPTSGYIVREVLDRNTFTVEDSEAFVDFKAGDRIRIGSNQTNPFVIIDQVEISFRTPGRHTGITTRGPAYDLTRTNGATVGAPIFDVEVTDTRFDKPLADFSPRGQNPDELVNKGYVDSEVGTLAGRLSVIDIELDHLGTGDSRFTTIEAEINSLQRELGYVETDVDSELNRINTIENRLRSLESELGHLDSDDNQQDLISRIDRIESELGHLDLSDSEDSDIISRLARLESDVRDLSGTLSGLTDVNDDVTSSAETGQLLSFNNPESEWQLSNLAVINHETLSGLDDLQFSGVELKSVNDSDDVVIEVNHSLYVRHARQAKYTFNFADFPENTKQAFDDIDNDSDIMADFLIRYDSVLNGPGQEISISGTRIQDILNTLPDPKYTPADFVKAVANGWTRLINGHAPNANTLTGTEMGNPILVSQLNLFQEVVYTDGNEYFSLIQSTQIDSDVTIDIVDVIIENAAGGQPFALRTFDEGGYTSGLDRVVLEGDVADIVNNQINNSAVIERLVENSTHQSLNGSFTFAQESEYRSDATGQLLGVTATVAPTVDSDSDGHIFNRDAVLGTNEAAYIKRVGEGAHRFVLPAGTAANFGTSQVFKNDSDSDFGFNIFGFLRSDTGNNVFHIPGPSINSHHFIGSILELEAGTVYTRIEFIAAMVLAMDRVIRGKQPTHVNGREVDLEATDLPEIEFMDRFSAVFVDPTDRANAIILVNNDNSNFDAFQTTAVIYDPTSQSIIQQRFEDYTTTGVQKIITDFTLHDDILRNLNDPFIEAFIGEGSIEHLSDVNISDTDKVNGHVLAYDSDNDEWRSVAINEHAADHLSLEDLSDVSDPLAGQNNFVLAWDSDSEVWMAKDPGVITEVHVKLTELDDVHAPVVSDGFVLAWDSDYRNEDDMGVFDGTLGAWTPVSVRTAVTTTQLGHLLGIDSEIDSKATIIADSDPENVAIMVRSQITGTNGNSEWRTVDLATVTPDGSPLMFENDGNRRRLTKYKDSDVDTPRTIRTSDFETFNGSRVLFFELTSFSPVFNDPSAFTLPWDTAFTSFRVTGENPTDFADQYIDGLYSITPQGGSTFTGWTYDESEYVITSTDAPSAGGGAWNQTFTPRATANTIVRSNTTSGLSGGNTTALLTYASITGTADAVEYTEPADTITVNWSNASTGITYTDISGTNNDGRTFLTPVITVEYSGSTGGISRDDTVDLNVVSLPTTTTSRLTVVDSDGISISGNVNLDGTDIQYSNDSEGTDTRQTFSIPMITRVSTFTRDSDVVNVPYQTTATGSDNNIEVDFLFPSLVLFTNELATPPSIDNLRIHIESPTILTSLADRQRRTLVRNVENTTAIPQAMWFAIPAGVTPPTIFLAGLVGAGSTVVTNVIQRNDVVIPIPGAPANNPGVKYELFGYLLQAGLDYAINWT